MKGLIKYGLAAAMVFATAMATPALAKEEKSFDICVDPTTDVKSVTGLVPGGFATVAANIFAEGTIPEGGTTCSTITSPVIGTFYANVGVQGGLPAASDVLAFVTWQFDFSPEGTFATIGSVPLVPFVGQTYIQTLVGSSGKFPGNGKVTVETLDKTGFQFRITLPKSRGDD
jgi:hypothetical protein